MTENDKKRVAKNKRDTAKAMVIKTVNKRGRVTVFYGCIPLVGRVFEDSIFRIQIHFACAYFLGGTIYWIHPLHIVFQVGG